MEDRFGILCVGDRLLMVRASRKRIGQSLDRDLELVKCGVVARYQSRAMMLEKMPGLWA